MTGDLRARFDRARFMPFGHAQVAELEEVAGALKLDQGDTFEFEVQLELASAYTFAGQAARSFEPLQWCLDTYDRDPDRYEAFEYDVLWHIKWLVERLPEEPSVPLGQLHALLDDMERRYAEAGHSLHALHQMRMLLTHHVGDVAEGERQLELLGIAERDDLSDCVACVPTKQAALLIDLGRHADALELAQPVLSGDTTCHSQPHELLTELLPAYMETGEHDQAARAHLDAYRTYFRRSDRRPQPYAKHILFLVRSGNHERAMTLVGDALPLLEDPDTPYSEMWLSAAAAAALNQVHPEFDIRIGDQDVPVAEAATSLAGRARELAGSFDARNGTSWIGDRIEEALAAPAWVASRLPITTEERRAEQLRAELHELPATPVVEVSLGGLDGGEVLDQVERFLDAGDHGAAAEALAHYDRLVPEEQRPTAEEGRRLDALASLLVPDQPREAIETRRQALALLDEAGDRVRLLRARGRLGLDLCRIGDHTEGLATAEPAIDELLQLEPQGMKDTWQLLLAEMLAPVRPNHAEKLLQELQSTELADPLGARAANLHARVLIELEQWDRTTATCARAVHLATSPRERLDALMTRAMHRSRTGDHAGAAADHAEQVALLLALGSNTAAARLNEAASHLSAGNPAAAAETAEAALDELGEDGPDELVLAAHSDLTDAYRDLGAWDRALEHARFLTRHSLPADLGWLLVQEGAILIMLDRHEEALARHREAHDDYAKQGDTVGQAGALRLAALVLLDLDDFDGAQTNWGQAEELLEGQDSDDARRRFCMMRLEQVRALSHRDPSRAVELARDGEQAARALGDSELIDEFTEHLNEP